MQKKLLLIDGHSILNRAFYGLPDLTNAEGRHTGAVYGFLTILYRFIEEEQPDALAVAFDVHAPTFRHAFYPEYKGKRKPMPEELREQVPLLKEVLDAMGIFRMEQAGLEADDLLGTAARRSEAAGWLVTIVSGDRDLLQVATDRIIIAQPKTVRGTTTVERFDAKGVEAAYGVSGERFIDLKALMGDASDNIPGLPKVGEKTAKDLMAQFGSGDAVFEHAQEITKKALKETVLNGRDIYELSRRLATIDQDAPFSFAVEKTLIPEGDATAYFRPEACALLRRLGFVRLLERYASQKTQAPAAAGENTEGAGAVKDAVRICGSADEAQEAFSLICGDQSGAGETDGDAQSSDCIGVCVLYDTGRKKGGSQGSLTALDSGDVLPGGSLYGVAVSYRMEQREHAFFLRPGPELPQKRIAEMLRDLSLRRQLAFYGITDFYRLLAETGIEPDKAGGAGTPCFDTQLAVYLLNPLASEPTVADAATILSCPETVRTWEERHGKDDYSAHPDDAAGFAVEKASLALEGRALSETKLSENGMLPLMQKVEMPLSHILYDMELLGVRVEKSELEAYGRRLTGRIDELEGIIHNAAGEVFNINSPKQLGEILFEKMHLPGGKKTKTGYSTAADVLEKLAPEAPVVRDILEYRGLTKLKSTYADGLAAFIGPDGRIHSRFHQMVTATGRISSSDPNLQNIPMRTELGRAIRRVFIPEEGFIFADADYSQIELRILAAMSGDPDLIEAYREGKDIHAITASKVFGVPFEEVTPLMRRNAKAVNFGIVYGISSFGLSQNIDISRADAAAYIKQYFETYPGVKRFLDSLVGNAREKGYAETLYGRRRPIPELKSSNFMQRSFGERVAMNAPIQGTAADIMKIAMIRVWRRLKEENLKSRLILQIHDELLIETAIDEKEAVGRILTEEMKGAASLAVPLEVDCHFGSDWFEAK